MRDFSKLQFGQFINWHLVLQIFNKYFRKWAWSSAIRVTSNSADSAPKVFVWMANVLCNASKFSYSLLFAGNQNIENHSTAAAELAIDCNGETRIFPLYSFCFICSIVSLSLCALPPRICLWRIINFSNACNFKINRLSGWRELVDETYFYFYATCHVTNFVLVCVWMRHRDLCIVLVIQ